MNWDKIKKALGVTPKIEEEVVKEVEKTT